MAGVVAAWLADIPHISHALAASIITAVGLVDDRIGLNGSEVYRPAASVLVYVIWGGRIEFVSNPFGGMFYLGYLSMPVTVFWILALINLMNFIDGLDGLAVGITIAALTVEVWRDLGAWKRHCYPRFWLVSVLVFCL